MKLEDWDRRIAPHLQAIGRCYARMAIEGSKLQNHLDDLPARPAWNTLARDNLNKLETMLRVLLAATQAAQRRYDDLPIIIESFPREAAE
jgi:hypothetical protein